MSYIQPFYPLLAMLTIIALVRHSRRCTEHKPRLLAGAIAAQCLFSLPLLSGWGSWTLEHGYSRSEVPPESAEAIVLLSGAVYGPTPARPAVVLGPDTYIRLQSAAWLFKNWKQIPVVVCGGEIESADGMTLADAMRDALAEEGVPREMIWCESRSKSTHENAAYAAEMLRENGIAKIVLVTEAFHMRRAAGCFRKEGLTVVPAPCAFRSGGFSIGLVSVVPGPSPIRRNEQTLHEWVAMLWYRMRGWM